jgi:hypothetical protein
MTRNAPIDDADEKPLDPAVERVRRKMMRLMAVSIGIMLVGLMAVLLAIVYKVTNRGAEPPVAGGTPGPGGERPFEALVELPAGGRIVSHSLAGTGLMLLAEDGAGRQTVILFDTVQGRETGRISFSAR